MPAWVTGLGIGVIQMRLPADVQYAQLAIATAAEWMGPFRVCLPVTRARWQAP